MEWLHYIGGFYSPDKFVEEARTQGVSRRVAPNVARGMSYGDLVHCLAWDAGAPNCFATFVVHGVSAQEELSWPVAAELEAEGKAKLVHDRCSPVVRACGSYVASISYLVTASLGEVVERLLAEAEELGIRPRLLLRGTLRQVYDPPRSRPTGEKFFRGYRKASGLGETVKVGSLTGHRAYARRTRVKRDDFGVQAVLPLELGAPPC